MLSNSTPANTNYLDSSRFRFVVSKLPNVNFFLQSTTLPGLNFGVAPYSTPFLDVDLPGDKISWNDLVVSFKADEDLRNWEEIFAWIVAMGHPQNLEQFKEILESSSFDHRPGKGGLYSDASLTILTNKFNPMMQFNFVDCFPVGLSEIPVGVTDGDIVYPNITATFRYSYYTIKRLK